MAIDLLGFVIQLRGERRQLRRGQRRPRFAKSGKENRVHTENLPGNVADREIQIVQLAHSQFFGALADFAENLGQERRQCFAIEIRRQLARHHKPVRQGDQRPADTFQRGCPRDHFIGCRKAACEFGPRSRGRLHFHFVRARLVGIILPDVVIRIHRLGGSRRGGGGRGGNKGRRGRGGPGGRTRGRGGGQPRFWENQKTNWGR